MDDNIKIAVDVEVINPRDDENVFTRTNAGFHYNCAMMVFICNFVNVLDL